MTDTQENKLSMFIKVLTFLTNNAAPLSSVAQIAGIKTFFETLIDNITTTAGLITEDNTGFTTDKADKRAELEAITLKVARASAAYFASLGNVGGIKTADYTSSELHGARDSELYSRAKRLHAIALPIAAGLSGFNSGLDDVEDLDTKKEAFFDVIQNPQAKRGEKSAYVIDLENYFTDGDDKLVVLDIYMDTFAAVNVNLHNQYLSARSIDNLGGGSGSGVTVISTVQNTIAASATSNPIVIPPATQSVRITITANGPLETGKTVSGTTHDGNTTTLSAPASATIPIADFASSGELLLVKNQSSTLAGAYKIEFLA